METDIYDVIIIGGGPAGLSAAMVLGRCCRKVVVYDGGKTRNRFSNHMNGYLTRDGISPQEFIELSRKELDKYGIKLIFEEAVKIKKKENYFEVWIEDGSYNRSRKIILATGVKDKIPSIPGLDKLYGVSVHHCPICDGWQYRGKSFGVTGPAGGCINLSLQLLQWSNDITVFTSDYIDYSDEKVKLLMQHNIKIVRGKIKNLAGEAKLDYILMENEEKIKCDTLFFATGYEAASQLFTDIGCRTTESGEIYVNNRQESNVEGVYIAGDACKDMKLVIISAAEGAKAAVTINKKLTEEDLGVEL
ncbi:MAG: NAD(P)/FAD-dependent oxidoreductase [Bacteroidia bacterium]